MTVPPGPSLADALISSPILAGEGGALLGLGASDFEFGVDPSADPELALVRNRHGEIIQRTPAQSLFHSFTPLPLSLLVYHLLLLKQEILPFTI